MALFKGAYLIILCASVASAAPKAYDHIFSGRATGRGSTRDEGDTELGRLPTTLYPITYKVALQPDIYTGNPPFTFNGSVSIRFRCQEPPSIIYLNSVGLNLPESSLQITTAPDSPVAAPDPVWIRTELDEALEFWKIFLEEALVQDAEYVLYVDFSGTLNTADNPEALWWESYEPLDGGDTKYMAVTMMWPDNARNVFPCFDEPQMKATFDITLYRKSNVVALANNEIIDSQNIGNGWIMDSFDRTPVMSTYLLCFVIGELAMRESLTANNITVRVWARPEYEYQLELADQVAAPILDWYQNWTGIDYPMPKLDHVAYPSQVGAMENWGLIMYNEDYMLYDPDVYSLSYWRQAASVIAHETAHQWFGNLVTLRWFDDAWLNEGFATHFETLPFDDVLGFSGYEEALQVSTRGVMEADSSNTSVAIRRQVDSPWDAPITFNTYTYSKGGAVLTMIKQVLGQDTFQAGLQRYLTAYAYGNVQTDDLWQALTEQAQEDGVTDTDGIKLFVKEKFDPWVDQRGFPMITANRLSPGTVQFIQQQFLNPRVQALPPSPYNYEWFVPLTWTGEDTMDFSLDTKDWLNRDRNRNISSELPPEADQWFMVNVGASGFYRVRYDQTTFLQIVDQLVLNASVIPTTVRYQIVNDAFEISSAGYQDEVVAMETTLYLDQEESFLVWDTVEAALRYQVLMLARFPDTYDLMVTYLRSKVDPVYSGFAWIPEEEDDSLKRSAINTLVDLACHYGNPNCIQEARIRFNSLISQPIISNVVPDQRVAVYCTSIANGTEADWDFLFSLYDGLADSAVRGADVDVDRMLYSMACPSQESEILKYINYTYDPALIRPSHAAAAIGYIASSRYGRWVMWDRFQTNWNNNPVPDGVSKYMTLLTVVRGFANALDVDELNSFIVNYPPQDANEEAVYREAQDIAGENNVWASDNEPAFNQWLLDNAP